MISKDYLDRFIYYDSTSRTGIRWKIDIWVAKNRISRKSNVGIPYIHYNEKLNRYQVALVLSGKRYTKTFPTLQHENALQSAVEYLLGKEEEMLKSGYTERQLNNIKKGINDSFSKSN